jgi:hypothetical protein
VVTGDDAAKYLERDKIGNLRDFCDEQVAYIVIGCFLLVSTISIYFLLLGVDFSNTK